MNPRPRAITFLGWLFLCFGVVAAAVGLLQMSGVLSDPDGGTVETKVVELAPMVGLNALVTVGGALLLRGSEWGRWLVAAWAAYHAGVGLLHPGVELIVHAALLVIVLYLLFRGSSNRYFHSAPAGG